MDEIRFQKVEIAVKHHDRRLGDHERMHAEAAARMASNEHFIAALQKSTAMQEKMVEVGENIILALGWASKAARWILTMGAFFSACWFGIKFVIAKASGGIL